MKKEYKLWLVGTLIAFCFIFQTAKAESLIIPTTDTISQYLKYRSGCRSNISDCMSANGLESAVESDIRSILGSIKKPDTDLQKLEKAREQLRKDSEASYKQLQDDLKSLSSRVDTNIKTGFTCVQPVASCTESTYQRIRAGAITNGLTPDSAELALCRSQIDDYTTKQQEYTKCQQDYINSKINHSAQMEYQAQLLKIQTDELKKDKYCKDKEGYYSSYDKNSGECSCVTGSTYINGWCHSDAQVKIDNFLGCIQKYGSSAIYDSGKGTCRTSTGEIMPTVVTKPTTTTKNRFLEILKQQDSTKKAVESAQSRIPKSSVEPSNEALENITPVESIQTSPVDQKITLWKRLKNGLARIKFW